MEPDIFHFIKVVINVLCLSSVALPCVFRLPFVWCLVVSSVSNKYDTEQNYVPDSSPVSRACCRNGSKIGLMPFFPLYFSDKSFVYAKKSGHATYWLGKLWNLFWWLIICIHSPGQLSFDIFITWNISGHPNHHGLFCHAVWCLDLFQFQNKLYML